MENIARAKKEDENFTADKADPELPLDLEVEGRENFEQKTQAVGQVSFDLKTFFLVQHQGCSEVFRHRPSTTRGNKEKPA